MTWTQDRCQNLTASSRQLGVLSVHGRVHGYDGPSHIPFEAPSTGVLRRIRQSSDARGSMTMNFSLVNKQATARESKSSERLYDEYTCQQKRISDFSRKQDELSH